MSETLPTPREAGAPVTAQELLDRFGPSVMGLSPTNRITLIRQLEAEFRAAAPPAPEVKVANPLPGEMILLYPEWETLTATRKLRLFNVERQKRVDAAKAA